MKEVLIRADDFGASPGSNEAILAGVRSGLVRNVGIMAPGPWMEHRLGELEALRGSICLGLHAVLTSEWATYRWGPVRGAELVPSLCLSDGTFPAKVDDLHRSALPEEAFLEVEAQLEKLRGLGVDPDYMDCHMCFNWHPDWDQRMRTLAEREGLVYHHHKRLPSVDVGVNGAEAWDPERLLERIRGSPGERPIWVFHPASRDATSERFYADPDHPSTAVAEQRDREYRFLTDPQVAAALLSAPDIEWIGYNRLREG